MAGRDTDMDDEAIWNKHRDELVRYASVLVGPDDAEDLLSTVVLRVLQKQKLSDLDDARPYLFRGVLNEARSLGRRRSRQWVSPAGCGVSDVLARPSGDRYGAPDGLPNGHRETLFARGSDAPQGGIR